MAHFDIETIASTRSRERSNLDMLGGVVESYLRNDSVPWEASAIERGSRGEDSDGGISLDDIVNAWWGMVNDWIYGDDHVWSTDDPVDDPNYIDDWVHLVASVWWGTVNQILQPTVISSDDSWIDSWDELFHHVLGGIGGFLEAIHDIGDDLSTALLSLFEDPDNAGEYGIEFVVGNLTAWLTTVAFDFWEWVNGVVHGSDHTYTESDDEYIDDLGHLLEAGWWGAVNRILQPAVTSTEDAWIDTWDELFDHVLSNLSGSIGTLYNLASAVIDTILGLFEDPDNAGEYGLEFAWGNIVSYFTTWLSNDTGILGQLYDFGTSAWNAVSSLFEDPDNAGEYGLEFVWGNIVSAFTTWLSNDTGILGQLYDFGTSAWNTVASLFEDPDNDGEYGLEFVWGNLQDRWWDWINDVLGTFGTDTIDDTDSRYIGDFGELVGHVWWGVVNSILGLSGNDELSDFEGLVGHVLGGAGDWLDGLAENTRTWLGRIGDILSGASDSTTTDLDLHTHDLKRVDRIFFDSNDGLDTTDTHGHISSYSSATNNADLNYFVPANRQHAFFVGSAVSRLNIGQTSMYTILPIQSTKKIRCGADTVTLNGEIARSGNDVIVRTGGKSVNLSNVKIDLGFTDSPPANAFWIPITTDSSPNSMTVTELDAVFGDNVGSIGIAIPENLTATQYGSCILYWKTEPDTLNSSESAWIGVEFDGNSFSAQSTTGARHGSLTYSFRKMAKLSESSSGTPDTSDIPIIDRTVGKWGYHRETDDEDDGSIAIIKTSSVVAYKNRDVDRGNTSVTPSDTVESLPDIIKITEAIPTTSTALDDIFGVDDGYVGYMSTSNGNRFYAKINGYWMYINMNT